MNVSVKLGVLALFTLLGACATTENEKIMFRRPHDDWTGIQKFGTYIKDVWLDLTDIGALDLSFGKSTFPAWANVRATKYAEVGGGGWSGYRFGWIKRSFGVWREERHDGLFAFGPIQNYSINGARFPHSGIGQMETTAYQYRKTYDIEADHNWHWTDFGASVHLLFVGAEANISPYEIFDFFGGLVTNWPNPADIGAEVPWDIRRDIADDDTPVSEYDNKLNKFRYNDYSVWPTILPSVWDADKNGYRHEEIEGQELPWPRPDFAPDGGGGWMPILKTEWTKGG